MIKDISNTWSKDAALIKRKNDYVVVSIIQEAYNNPIVVVYAADKHGVVKDWTPIQKYENGNFKKICKKLEYIPRIIKQKKIKFKSKK